MHQLFTATKPTYKSLYIRLFYVILLTLLLGNIPFANAQNGYIYVHNKTLNEESSVNFPFTLTGGPTTVPAFTLNDQPDNIAPVDLGADRAGGLWAAADGNGLYFRPSNSSTWTQKVSGTVQRVDGGAAGTCYYILANSVYYFNGSSSTLIGKPGGQDAADIASNGTYTVVTTTSGLLYRVNTSTFTAVTMPAGVKATYVDVDAAGNVYLREGTASVNANRISKLTSAGALTAYASGGLFSSGDLAVSDDASVLLQESQFGGFFTAYRYNSSSNTWVLEPESRGMNALTGGPGGQMWGVFALSGKPNTILTRTYTGTGPSGATSAFWIDDERVGTNTPDNSILIPVASGNYSLAETIPTGWDVTGITIYDPSGNSTANVANGTAVIKVTAGEVVHVVMENTLFQVTTVASNCGDTFTETFGTGAVGSVGSPLTGLTSYHQATSVRQVQDGEYTIVSRSQDSGYGTMFDHTSGDGTGRMLMVNASYAKDIFYIRQFTGMVIGASYDLSIWAGSITGGLDPHISMEVYNDADNSLLASTTTGDVTTDNTWLNFHLPFTPTTPNIYIVLRNLNIGGDGNDLVIDDISFGLTCDHGDAPASYGTTNANLGVGHIITPTLTIGTTVDQEPDGISGTTALGDDQNGTDDEDGVASFPALNVSTTSYDLTVAVNNKLSKEATLSGWIDFNRNGTFDANERAQVVVPKNTTSAILHWTGLSGLSAGVTYARLRIATLASDVDLPTGAADDGEVEDYTLNISLNISGTVYNDANGLSDNTVSGTGTNAGGLNAILFDNTTGKVAAITPVAANGTYSFTATAGDGYTVYVTSNTATVGSTTIPTITLPTGWANTGEYSGTGAGNDGTVNGILPLGTVNTSLSTANFGIEQLPTPGKGANTVGNNGGTSPVTVPANTFTNTTLSSDVSPGTVTSIRITAFPTNTTSLTINGTIYTSLPTGGITVPTDGSGNPTVAIAVDPTNDSNPVVITFVAVDNAGKESTTTGTATINFLPAITVSGKVWDDADGSLSQNGSETGTNAGGPLYVNLVNASNTVVASVSVAADGSYALSGVPTNVTGYKLVLASTATATTPGTLPTGWVNTGESVDPSNTVTQGSILGLIELSTATSAVVNQNFGIEKLPSAGSGSNTVVNAGGTSPVTVAANTFTNGGSSTDTAPGSVTAIRVTAFPSNATSLTINGSVYTASSPEFSGATPTGVVVPTDGNGNPTVAIAVDPTNDANPVSIPFKAVDNAGQESTNTGTAVISSTLVFTIAGTVFDDANGQTDNTVNGIAVNGPTLPVYVSLVSSGTIVATLPVTAAGSYTFTGVSAGTYSVVLTTNPSGSTTPDLPINWFNTAENLGTGSGSDGTADGVLTLTVAASSITDANFGIEQLPTATSTTLASQPNPGGTLPIVVPPASFTGTDPDGTVASVIYTGFPTEVTSMTINGTAYTAASFPPAGVTATVGSPVSFDPTDAATSVVIPFQVVDNAGKTSPNTATVTLPLSTPLTLSGTVFNDADGGTIDGTATNVIAGNTFYVSIMDPTTGNVISTTAVASDGTYSLPVNPNTSYQVVLSTAPQTVGSPVSATLLTGAAHTAEGTAPTGDGTPDGQTGVSVVTTSVTGVNFGIDPLPTPGSGSATVANAGGVSAVTVPPTAFTSISPSTDTTPGSVTAIHVTSFPTNVTSLTINGTVYTSLPVGGIVVPTNSSGAPTVPILMDPTNDANPVVFTFTAIDNAGKESTTTGTATLNFTGVPDLTPIIYARPSTTYNTTTISVVVDVFELKNVSTSGLITVKVNKDPKISLSFTGSATSVGGRSVSNSAWSFDGTLDDDYYVLTTTQVIAGGNVLSFGLNGTLTPGATSGTLTLTTVIDGGSGGEMKINNNTDADKIDFFQQ